MLSDKYGQPRAHRTNSVRTLDTLIAVLALVFVVEIVVANVDAARDDIRLVGPPTAAALLTAVVLVRVLRNDVTAAVRPMLRVVSQWVTATTLGADDRARYRSVAVKNVGAGTAIIVSVRWLVARESTGGDWITSLARLHEVLAALGYQDGRDYSVSNYSRGTALAVGEQRVYFECTDAFVDGLASFDVVFEFESPLGDRYERRAPLLPGPDAPTAVNKPPGLVAA